MIQSRVTKHLKFKALAQKKVESWFEREILRIITVEIESDRDLFQESLKKTPFSLKRKVINEVVNIRVNEYIRERWEEIKKNSPGWLRARYPKPSKREY